MASSTFSDLPAPACERGPLNNTLIIIVNNDGTLTVDQETLHKLLAEQESTSTNAVRLIRLGVAPTDCRSPASSDGEDAAGSGHVNITVEGYYPPGHGYRLAPDEPLEPVIADEMNRLGQVNAMLDMLSADEAFSIHDSIKMDHCYTNRLPCSDPNYAPPRPKAPEGRSFFTPLKKPVVSRAVAVPPIGKVMLVHPVKRAIPRVGVKPPATGSLLKPMERPAPPPPPPVGITEEMLNEKMMQFQRGSDDYNDLSGDDKSNSSAEQSVDVEDFALAAGAPASAGGKTAPRPQKAVVYKGPNHKGTKRSEADETSVGDANRTPKMHAHKLIAAGLKVYGKAKPVEARKEITSPSIDDSKKNYPRRENRKPPAHLLESFAGPALFSVPDVPRRVSMDAKGARSFDAADLDFGGACETPETPETPESSAEGQSLLTSMLLDQLDASVLQNSGEKAQRQSVDTVSSDSLGEMDMVTEDDPNKLWCICQRPHNNRFMICCDVCGEWFHGKCVGITKAIGQTMEEHGNEWTCPNCKKMGDAPGTGRRQSKITTFMRKPKPTESAPPPVEEPPVASTSCVVCKKTARDGTVYCSDDCLQKHAHETAMMEMHLAQPSVPQLETPKPVHVAAPAVAEVSTPVADKPQTKKAAPVTCGVKTSRPGSLKTWLKPNPSVVKSMPVATATSSPIKPKQVVLIDAKPMPPTVPQKQAKLGPASETNKDVATEKVTVLMVPKLVLSPIKEKSVAKHDGKRISRVEVKVPEAPKKEETEPIRINVRKTLHEQLLARTTECEDLKGISDEKVQRIALHIEEELFTYFNKDAGCKYKSKYRSLIFNIKDPKNLTLFRKIVDKSISAHQLVRLSAEEFASQELTQWREQETKHQLEMIKKNEMELMALSKTYVMKTHKGEQVIESEDGVKSDASKIVDMDIDSVTSADAKLKSKDKKAKSKSKSKKSRSHKSSRDKKKHHSKSSKHHKNSHESSSSSSTQKKLDDYVRVVDRREDLNVSKDSDFDNGYTGKDLEDSKPAPAMDASSVQEIIFGKACEDQDMEVDESGSPGESITTPEHSSIDDQEAVSTVWRGMAEMPDVAKFQTTIQAVSGDSEKHCQTLPDHINIVGRISPNTVWEHVSKMKKTETHEILVVRLTAKNENEKIAYVTLYSYLNTRNRLGVVGRKGVIAPVSQSIKDFYILPLSNHSPIPQALLPLQGPGLEEDRPHLLLGILIARSGRKRPAPAVSYVTKAPRLADSADTVQVFTPPLPDDESAPSPPKPPSPSRDSRPCTPETESRSTAEENSETEAETIRAKVTCLLDEDAPYSPKDDDEDAPVGKLTDSEESSMALQRKMDELNRKIAEQKLEIESISSGLGSDSLIPGLGSIPSFMGTEFPTSKDADEAYSPSESITPPLKEAIPFISMGSRAPADIITPEISLPSNLHEILASIKKNAAVEPKMDLKHDPIVQSYSARMDEEKEKIAAKKEQFSAVYIPSSIKKGAELGASKSDEPHETPAKDSLSGKAASVVAKSPVQLQMQAASGDPRKRPAMEPPKPKSTLSKLTDAELIEKAAAMELEMAATPSPVPTVVKKAAIKFSIPSQFGRAPGVGCLPEAPPPLPPPPPPPPPEIPSTQSKRLAGLNSLASMPCNPPPPNVDFHIPFTNPPAPMLGVNPPPPPPPLPGTTQPPPFPSRATLPGRIPLPPLPGMHPLPPAPGMNPPPPVPGMNPLPPLPGRSPLPPLPGMNPLPPLPGMNPPAPGNHSLYTHHPPPYRRGNYDRNH